MRSALNTSKLPYNAANIRICSSLTRPGIPTSRFADANEAARGDGRDEAEDRDWLVCIEQDSAGASGIAWPLVVSMRDALDVIGVLSALKVTLRMCRPRGYPGSKTVCKH